MKRLLLIPLGILAAAEHEAELLALREQRHKVLEEGLGPGKGVVDLDLFVSLGIRELGRSSTDGP